MQILKSMIDCATKLAVIGGIIVVSHWALSNVREMKSAQALAQQTNAINNVLVQLKALENKDVDRIVGIKR